MRSSAMCESIAHMPITSCPAWFSRDRIGERRKRGCQRPCASAARPKTEAPQTVDVNALERTRHAAEAAPAWKSSTTRATTGRVVRQGSFHKNVRVIVLGAAGTQETEDEERIGRYRQIACENSSGTSSGACQ